MSYREVWEGRGRALLTYLDDNLIDFDIFAEVANWRMVLRSIGVSLLLGSGGNGLHCECPRTVLKIDENSVHL